MQGNDGKFKPKHDDNIVIRSRAGALTTSFVVPALSRDPGSIITNANGYKGNHHIALPIGRGV
jgi:hypothetical protein